MDTTTGIADGLDREIAALKTKAADYAAQHKVIDNVTWPNGARIAVNFTSATLDWAAGGGVEVATDRGLEGRAFGGRLPPDAAVVLA